MLHGQAAHALSPSYVATGQSISGWYIGTLVGIMLLTIATVAFGVPIYKAKQREWRLDAATVFGVFFGLVGAVLVVHTLIFWQSQRGFVQCELACLIGASAGWLIGMWLSPMSSSEGVKFNRYWAAVGVGSGVTLKWAMDAIWAHRFRIMEHSLEVELAAISLLITAAAVYNSRAYQSSLTIAARNPDANSARIDGAGWKIAAGKSVTFFASVVGPNDPLVHWEVFPAACGSIDDAGVFHAGSTAGLKGKITAFSVEDPALSNVVPVEVVQSF